MSDLIKRLRRYSCESDDPTEPLAELVKDLHEAADRIEELESKVESLLGICGDPRDKARIAALEGEVEGLRVALNKVANCPGVYAWNPCKVIARAALEKDDE
jgi:hypothetical protein